VTAARRTTTGPGRPAGADAAVTRGRVIEAAQQFFANRGYAPATNKAIADAAGVTAGAVYYHFGSKAKLFAAACQDAYDLIFHRYAAEITEPAGIREILRQLLEVSMRLNRDHRSLAGFVATAPLEARRHPELADTVRKQADRRTAFLLQRVAAGQQAGLIPAELDPAQVAALIGLLLHGFADAAAELPPDVLERQATLFDTLISGRLTPR
jgi:AcrR family transcriptional regulator